MSDIKDFAEECDFVAKQLRRLPSDVRRALASEVKTAVALPLAGKIGSAARGPYGAALSGSVKARAAADPTIVIGGSRKVVSGGANARQLIYGTEFGGGKRITRVPTTPKRAGYRRRSTNQFVPAYPFVFPTVGKNMDWVLDTYADIVLKTLDKGVNSNG